MIALQQQVDGLARVPWLLAPSRPRGLERAVVAYREVLGRVYRAVRSVSGASVIVDSSKYATYGGLLAGVPGLDLRALHLVRDSRAVAYSWRRSHPAARGGHRGALHAGAPALAECDLLGARERSSGPVAQVVLAAIGSCGMTTWPLGRRRP
jgi:hypothetical protein